jgi:clan AA aspartic protease (TIGR02281 family)
MRRTRAARWRQASVFCAVAGLAGCLSATPVIVAAQTVMRATISPVTISPATISSTLPSNAASPLPNVITPGHYRDTATATRGRNGHFVFDTQVNGVALPMLFDTGASTIALRAEDAAQVGIDVGALQYSVIVSTANGKTRAAPVKLDSVTIGSITRQDIPALVVEPGKLSVNLLGQTFLSRLAGFQLQGQQLVLEGGQ